MTVAKKPSVAMIDKHRHINVEHGWWEDTYSTFKEDMSEKHGLNVAEINFSGFCSQGDGASFTGRVESENMVKFFKSLSLDTAYPAIFEYVSDKLQPADIDITRNRSRYYHSNTCSAELRSNQGWGPCWETLLDNNGADDFMLKCGVIRDAKLKEELEGGFERVLNDTVRALMDDVYSRLREEYDDLTSDESVIQAMADCDILEEDEEDELVDSD